MKVAILGGGNGAYAAAADLTEQGHTCALWRRDAAALASLSDKPIIRVLDHAGERDVTIAGAHADIGVAVADATVIVFPGPAIAQDDVAEQLAPHLRDGQIIFLPPGTFGSYVMMKRLRDKGCKADVCFAETGTLPYLARKRGENTIAIARRATRLPTGFFPANRDALARTTLAQVFPAIEPCEDALSGALMNAGPIIHPPLIMMNAGPIQHFDHWDIHNEGTQPAIRSVTDTLDAERVAVREALGYGAPHFPLAHHYAKDGEEWMYGRAAHGRLVDSGDWREHLDLHRHRYMREDVQLGLAFLVSCARYCGVDAPVASGLLNLGGSICGEDFVNGPRTLESLKLSALSREALSGLLKDGI